MVSGVPDRVLLPLSQVRAQQGKWFTQAELASDLRVSVRTLRRWLVQMHHDGQGPKADQVRVFRRNAFRRMKLYRADFCLLVERRFCLMK